MTLKEFAEKISADASVPTNVAMRVIRAMYDNANGQLDADGTAQLPTFGKITSKDLADGRKHYTLHRRKAS